MTKDNLWGEAILAKGEILMRSGEKFIAYKYSISRRRNNSVLFERLPNLPTDNLDDALLAYHSPNSIESAVLVRPAKPCSVKETVIPYFAYTLIGFNR